MGLLKSGFLFFTELISTAIVIFQYVEIFKTHGWLPLEPTTYFNCKGENWTFLPDVKENNALDTFRGEESWQPLTEFSNRKCKQCGFYEDRVKSDDVFGKWEFCPSDFTSPDGMYIRSMDKEFNATFSCRECVHLGAESKHASNSENGGQGMHWTVLISVLVSAHFLSLDLWLHTNVGRKTGEKSGPVL